MASALLNSAAATVASSVLQSPFNEHHPVSEKSAFPRVDEAGVCWQPAAYEGQAEEQWSAYTDHLSEFDKNDLEWSQVPCKKRFALQQENEDDYGEEDYGEEVPEGEGEEPVEMVEVCGPPEDEDGYPILENEDGSIPDPVCEQWPID